MSHPRAIALRFAMIRAMSRLALLALLVAGACSKSAGNQDKPATPPPPGGQGQGDVIAVPGGKAPAMGQQPATPPPVEAKAGGTDDARYKLQPQEGKVAIEVPADAKPGAETVAKVTVTPNTGYHVNVEYPTKLTLTPADGVKVAKADFEAGGSKKQGDAEALDEKQLVFAVKLTPSAAGSYTINGNFKFAVCDKDQCLPKREAIAIQVAAK